MKSIIIIVLLLSGFIYADIISMYAKASNNKEKLALLGNVYKNYKIYNNEQTKNFLITLLASNEAYQIKKIATRLLKRTMTNKDYGAIANVVSILKRSKSAFTSSLLIDLLVSINAFALEDVLLSIKTQDPMLNYNILNALCKIGTKNSLSRLINFIHKYINMPQKQQKNYSILINKIAKKINTFKWQDIKKYIKGWSSIELEKLAAIIGGRLKYKIEVLSKTATGVKTTPLKKPAISDVEYGRLKDKLNYYLKMIENEPDNPKWYYMIGNIYLKLGNYQKANYYYNMSIIKWQDRFKGGEY